MNRVERLIRLRKEHPEFGAGEWGLVDTGELSICAIRASGQSGTSIAVHNLAAAPCRARFTLPDAEAGRLVDAWRSEPVTTGRDGVCELDLEGYGYRWLRVVAP
jgi:hypothetical protein